MTSLSCKFPHGTSAEGPPGGSTALVTVREQCCVSVASAISTAKPHVHITSVDVLSSPRFYRFVNFVAGLASCLPNHSDSLKQAIKILAKNLSTHLVCLGCSSSERPMSQNLLTSIDTPPAILITLCSRVVK